jgi:hypothetical protein
LVGHLDPDLRGFNAGLAVSRDQVFIGTWGNDEVCPGNGVRVVDVSNPEQPVRLASFAGGGEFPGTAADSIWVGTVHTPRFGGELAVVGLRVCDDEWVGTTTRRFAGFAVYDVNDPENPIRLSAVHSGGGTRGAHDVDVMFNGRQLLAAVTVPGSHLDHPDGLGDVRLYDLTNPSAVVQLSDWSLRKDGPPLLVGLMTAGAGDLSAAATGASWIDPGHVVVAHAPAGLTTLDVSDPSSPSQIGFASGFDASADVFDELAVGPPPSAHSGWMFDETVFIQDDVRVEPYTNVLGDPLGWGQQVSYDMTDPANARPIAVFGTERSKPGVDGEVGLDGFYGVRGSAPLADGFELVAWSSDGVRIVDMRDPARPVEAAYFVPPSRPDPQGWWVAPSGNREMPLAWGAIGNEGFVYIVDANSGLWIVRLTIPADDEGLPFPE